MAFRKKLAALIFTSSLVAMTTFATPAFAAVHIQQGPTKIDQGMANHKDDITIYNDQIAASFAVGSNNYWNMTNGSILDVALMNPDGSFGIDLINDTEFLNNLWSATGSYNGENLSKADEVTYTLYKNGKEIKDPKVKEGDKIVVKAKTRYWQADHKKPLNVTIEYTLEDGKNYIGLKTTVENPKDNDTYKGMYGGYSLSTLAANMFGPFGYYPDLKITGIGIGDAAGEKYGNFVATYGKMTYSKGYAVSVQMDGANAYKGSSGYKDLYTLRDIEAGKTFVYTGEMLISDRDETATVLDRFFAKDASIKKGSINGKVEFGKKVLKDAYVIVEKEGSYINKEGKKVSNMQPFVWTVSDKEGKYTMNLPEGKYLMHAEAKGCTPSKKVEVTVKDGKVISQNFEVQQGAKADFTAVDQYGNPINAKIEVSGVKTDIKTLGGTVFFMDPKTNTAQFNIPAGKLTFTASYGKDYESEPVVYKDVEVKPGETLKAKFVIPTIIEPEENNWYGMDNHQHSDIGDGSTPIEELYKAQIAAKLDFNVVSDHDAVENNPALAKLAKEGNRAFIPSLEVSPGWGHWGILNVDYTKPVISANLTPAEIIKAGHDMGSIVVVNHPYSDYGFFKNRDGVKGGFDKGSEDFDLIELQSTIDLTKADNMDKLALDLAMSYWNKGVKKYLSAGSDQHDVTSALYPGIIRLYAHIDGDVTTNNYLKALTEGHAYVTMGPIFTPGKSTMFGSTQTVKSGEKFKLDLTTQAVHGLNHIDVYQNGKVIQTIECKDTKEAYKLNLELSPKENTWYSFVAVDGKGRYAVSNPVWVNVK